MTALFVKLERDIPDFDPYVNGSSISKAEGKLERISKDVSVKPLLEFYSQNPEDAAAFIEGEGGDPGEIDIPPEQWFDAAAGLETVGALLEHLTTNPHAIPDADRVCAELNEWRTVLKRAADEGVRWHAEVDF